jgi:hypothetical protein
VLGSQPPDKPARKITLDHALERADVDAAVAGLEPVDGGGPTPPFRQQVAAVLSTTEPSGVIRTGLRAARPVEHRAADGLLQRGDLLAHRSDWVLSEAGRRPGRTCPPRRR